MYNEHEKKTNHSLVGKSCRSFFLPLGVNGELNNADEFGTQGGKIIYHNHECISGVVLKSIRLRTIFPFPPKAGCETTCTL